MKSRCFIPDQDENGESKRWCKECKAFLSMDMFHQRSCGFRELLCKTHIAARQRGVYKVRADAMAFCNKIGVEFQLTVDDLRIIEEFHDLDVYRPVPINPHIPLTFENTCLVTLPIRKSLLSFVLRGKDMKYYLRIVQKSGRAAISGDDDDDGGCGAVCGDRRTVPNGDRSLLPHRSSSTAV
jgi:hypothetical protein